MPLGHNSGNDAGAVELVDALRKLGEYLRSHDDGICRLEASACDEAADLIARLTLPAEPSEDETRDALIRAYKTGATDVHKAWCAGDAMRHADFTESAHDYADHALAMTKGGGNVG